MRLQTKVSRSKHARSSSTPHASDDDGRTVTTTTFPQVPWWSDLTPEVSDELRLPSYAAHPVTTADIVVIGGGITGLSAALSASLAGARVVVLERAPLLGYGATGRNAGILSAGVNMGLADLLPDSDGAAFWPATTRVLLSLVEQAQQPASLLSARLTGALSIAESANAARHLAREVHVRVTAGLHAELWTAEQVAERTQGQLNIASVVQAMWLPDEGRVQPLTLLAHMARQARVAGVQLIGQAQVVQYQEGEQHGVHQWLLTLDSGAVVKARGLIQSVGPTAQPNARIYALAFAIDLPDTFPLFWDAAPYTYADYRAGNGRLTVSGGRYGKAGVTRRDAIYYQRLANGARRWLPMLATQQPRYQWAVDLDVASDMVPGIRPFGKTAPARAVEGLGALGVLPGMVLGQRVGKELAHAIGTD